MPHVPTFIQEGFGIRTAIGMQKELLAYLSRARYLNWHILYYIYIYIAQAWHKFEPRLLAKCTRIMLSFSKMLGSLVGDTPIWHRLADRRNGFWNPGSIELAVQEPNENIRADELDWLRSIASIHS